MTRLHGQKDSVLSVRERLRTHKVFTKDKIAVTTVAFFLDCHQFSIK